MVPILSLWLPIVLAAVFVFFASFLFHMLLPLHRNDYKQLPTEDAVMDALRPFDIPPGDYLVPCARSPEVMRTSEFQAKRKRGPVILMTVMQPGPVTMGKNLLQWFLYCVFIGVLVAYVTGRAVPAGTSYLQVFRFAGVTAFIAYSIAMWQDSIWYQRSWGTTMRNTLDGLIYGLLTAGTFGWLWPR